MDPNIFDLAVVGTGIIGATAVALAAARDPEASIVGVCAGAVPDGSTTCSLALDIPAGHNEAQRELVAWSAQLHSLLGSLAPAWRRQGRESYWLLSAELAAELGGHLVGDKLTGCEPADLALLRSVFGERIGTSGSLLLRSDPATLSDPGAVVRELLAPLLRQPRNALAEGFAVDRIEPVRGGYRLLARDGSELTARRVLAAPGPWALSGPFRRTAEYYGARTKKIVAYSLRSEPEKPRPLLNLEEHDAFLLPGRAPGSWLLSIRSQAWDCPPDRALLAPDGADRALAERILAETVPDFPAEFLGSRVGADTYLPDRVPLVVPLDEQDGVVLATGGAGSGFRLAPAIADQALDLLGFRNHTRRTTIPGGAG